MPGPMTLELLAALEVIEDDVMAVVNAYMADPGCGSIVFGERYRIDPASALAEHPFASTLMRQPWVTDDLRLAAVRAAVMLAQPERA